MLRHPVEYLWKCILLSALLLLARQPVAAVDAAAAPRLNIPRFTLTIGQVGIADNLSRPTRYGIELRLRAYTLLDLIPTFGYARAESGANFLYFELRHDFLLSDRWLLIPSFGVGEFQGSRELQLGNALEFRSGLEVAFRVYDQYRVGVAVYHASNGGISNYNPGTEELVATFSIPLPG